MKPIIILFFAFIAAFSAYSQTYIQDGDRCFESGDYACAVTNYNNAFKSATGKDKQLIEIKLTRAKWCDEHLKTANQEFSGKKYTTAKDEYQKVLDSNPKDSYAQSQIMKCVNALTRPKSPKATTAELTSNSDNSGSSSSAQKEQPKEEESIYWYIIIFALYFYYFILLFT